MLSEADTLTEARAWLNLIAHGDLTFGATDGELAAALLTEFSRLEARAAQADLAIEHAMTQERLRAEFAVEADRLRSEAETAKEIIRRGWDDHMWNFECMDETDEAWLLVWAGHPSGRVHAEAHPWPTSATGHRAAVTAEKEAPGDA